jgi:hypothetical protein
MKKLVSTGTGGVEAASVGGEAELEGARLPEMRVLRHPATRVRGQTMRSLCGPLERSSHSQPCPQFWLALAAVLG